MEVLRLRLLTLCLPISEENRAFWLIYDKKPSAQGAHVSQAIAVGLGKATVLAVPEGIRRLFDAIPLIWGALSRYISDLLYGFRFLPKPITLQGN